MPWFAVPGGARERTGTELKKQPVWLFYHDFPGGARGTAGGDVPDYGFYGGSRGDRRPGGLPSRPAGASGKTALPLRFFRRPVDIPLGNSYNHSRTNKQEGACL